MPETKYETAKAAIELVIALAGALPADGSFDHDTEPLAELEHKLREWGDVQEDLD